MGRTWDSVREGIEIPWLEKTPTSQQLVQWAAASGDFYQIHYDAEFALGAGLPGIIVHGALKHAFLGQLLQDWIGGSRGRIKRFGCHYHAMDAPGALLRARGVVTRKYQHGDEKLVDLDIWIENADGRKTTTGTATISLPG